jgi:hypothetical protein
MIRTSNRHLAVAFGALLVGVIVAGCGNDLATPSPSPTPAPSAAPTASPSTAPSQTPAGSPSASPASEPTLALPHVDAALEDLLPGIVGGISLEKWSWPLSSYLTSDTGGDKKLYTPWLVKLGTTPDKVDMAVASDLTQTERVVVEAIKVPGVDSGTLTRSFAQNASNATPKWPVKSQTIAGKPVVQITDPVADANGDTLSSAYIFAKGNVLYLIITDSPSILLEVLIKIA